MMTNHTVNLVTQQILEQKDMDGELEEELLLELQKVMEKPISATITLQLNQIDAKRISGQI
jgi:hypothetical protein